MKAQHASQGDGTKENPYKVVVYGYSNHQGKGLAFSDHFNINDVRYMTYDGKRTDKTSLEYLLYYGQPLALEETQAMLSDLKKRDTTIQAAIPYREYQIVFSLNDFISYHYPVIEFSMAKHRRATFIVIKNGANYRIVNVETGESRVIEPRTLADEFTACNIEISDYEVLRMLASHITFFSKVNRINLLQLLVP
jgi:hypothetical protein